MKKSKERREEPLGTMSYETSSKRSPPFWLALASSDKASQKFLATKQYLGIQWGLQWNIDTTKDQGISKTCSLYQVSLSRVFNSALFSDQGSKAVHKRAHLVKFKGNGCSLLKGSAQCAAIGYKIVIIQIEGYSGIKRQKLDRLTA